MQSSLTLKTPFKEGDTIIIPIDKSFKIHGEEVRNDKLFLKIIDEDTELEQLACVEDLKFRGFSIIPKEDETPKEPEG